MKLLNSPLSTWFLAAHFELLTELGQAVLKHLGKIVEPRDLAFCCVSSSNGDYFFNGKRILTYLSRLASYLEMEKLLLRQLMILKYLSIDSLNSTL